MVIGLECHVQLATRSKIFSWAPAAYGAAPNANIDPVCLGMPGVLPVLNRAAVEHALRLALATRCEVRRRSRFARKHYFYPDLPKGYQITQYDEPLAERGAVDFILDGEPRSVRLTRIHLEEDAGKSIHAAGAPASLVDYNRAGVPLAEVVTEPDLRSAAEAGEYLRALRRLVRWLGICDGNLEEGSLRCDANVSLRPPGTRAYGTKVELKNLNSFRHVELGIAYEVARQAALYERGERVAQETRLWDADAGETRPMRGKEHAHDYRYFPEPDLPPLAISDDTLARVQAALPELPLARRARLRAERGLPDADAAALTEERALADYFEQAAAAADPPADPKKCANWILSELQREWNRDGTGPAASPLPAAGLAELVRLVDDGTISGKIAKDVFAKAYESRRAPRAIVEAEGLVQLSDEGALEAACRAAVDANPKEAERYRGGNAKLLGFFVGQVMKATKGKGNPGVVNDLLRRILDGDGEPR